jgi:non-specific serine/threonine protein kinase
MAAIEDARSVPNAMLEALGLREERGRSATDVLIHFLADKSILLVLDNCEHLVAACSALVRQVVLRCPGARLLVTSREELHLDGQAVFVVPHMTLPDEDAPLPSDAARQYDAIRLFVDRASTAQRGFAIRDDNLARVVRVCRRLEGIPLAIELAAARVPFLSLDQLEARLAERFHVLKDGRRASRPGHESMAAAISWSYELLPTVQRNLLQRLSVFRGGWTLEAAEAVCAGEGIDDADMLDLLVELAAKSLISVRQAEPAPRYGMLETVREFVEQQSEASGERRHWRMRHLEHYLAYAERAAPELQGPDAGRWADRVHADHRNFSAACRSAIELDLAEQGLRLGKALRHWWILTGRYDEALEMQTTLAAVEPDADLPRLRSEALRGGSWSAKIHGDVPRAAALLEQALAHARRSGDGVAVGHVLTDQASLAHDRGDLEAATDKAREGIQHFQRGGASSRALAGAKDTLATVLCDQTRYDEARQLYLESLDAHRELKDSNAIAGVLNNLAVLEQESGNGKQARHYYREARELYKETGHRAGLAVTNLNLGLVELSQDEHALALQRFEESLADFRALKHSEGVRMALMQAANARQHFDDFDAARRYLDELLSQVGEKENPIATGQALTCYAGLEIDCGAALRGARLLGAAESVYTRSGGVPEPSEVKRRTMMLERAGETLDDEQLKRAVAEGRTLEMGEAVAYALGKATWEALASG